MQQFRVVIIIVIKIQIKNKKESIIIRYNEILINITKVHNKIIQEVMY